MNGWAELLIGTVKKYGREYETYQKDRRRYTSRPKWKKGNKIGKDFWATKH
jgi:hypothetical protein